MAYSFAEELKNRNPAPDGRQWLFVPYDQLTDDLGPLSREDPGDLGIVLVECPWKAGRRPYHKQKLALILSNLRSFALEQAKRGVAVRHVVSPGSYADGLAPLIEEIGPLRMMEPAERELRVDLDELVQSGSIEVLPHEGWLTEDSDFDASCGSNKKWRMDSFYRHVRKRTGILMEDGSPVGGKLSFDAENRQAWKGDPPAPEPPTFAKSGLKLEVAELIETHFGDHPGQIDLRRLPATKKDARSIWSWAKSEAMPNFGPYEDAMSTQSRLLFHTGVSSVLNLHRILPRDVVEDVLELDIPLSCKEGFVRQVLGWREFVRHVHRRTDGFRDLPADASSQDSSKRPSPKRAAKSTSGKGSRSVARSQSRSAEASASASAASDKAEALREAPPNYLGANEPLPPAFWGTESGLHCLDTVVQSVWEEGYSHHITRLMVLSNLATLLDCSPRELTDWFWIAYTDAYDWVVEPNVLAMGTFAVGDLMTTKPYVSGAPYIHKMSDYCKSCTFDPKKTCPITHLYWAFLARHKERLGDNPRLGMPYRSLEKRSKEKRALDKKVFTEVQSVLARGEICAPGKSSGKSKASA